VLRIWEILIIFLVIFVLTILAEEMMSYAPGVRENAAGWRETGNYNRSKVFIFI
jgi:hypothetical protein